MSFNLAKDERLLTGALQGCGWYFSSTRYCAWVDFKNSSWGSGAVKKFEEVLLVTILFLVTCVFALIGHLVCSWLIICPATLCLQILPKKGLLHDVVSESWRRETLAQVEAEKSVALREVEGAGGSSGFISRAESDT